MDCNKTSEVVVLYCIDCFFVIQGEPVTVRNMHRPKAKIAYLDEMADACRGQGTCYNEHPWQTPNLDNHFNFLGYYTNLCCYCARQRGWNAISFRELACTPCQKEAAFAACVEAFANGIKHARCFWAELDKDLVNLIASFARRPRISQ